MYSSEFFYCLKLGLAMDNENKLIFFNEHDRFDNSRLL